MIYEKIVSPLLWTMEPEDAHHRALRLLNLTYRYKAGRSFLSKLTGDIPNKPVRIMGLTFPNVLGLAAGFDKNATCVRELISLGFGHIEVGTVTPQPQIGNPKPRVYRDSDSLWNNMGFPNDGAKEISGRLRKLSGLRDYVIGVSIGKQDTTPIQEATKDYLEVLESVNSYADYIAVNVSSPNTEGLTTLQGKDLLRKLLLELKHSINQLSILYNIFPRPLLVKISPSLTKFELCDVIETAEELADGIIATNSLSSYGGGRSGTEMGYHSIKTIESIRKQSDIPIIGVGGINDAASARRRLDAGANLLQLYTGLVYGGPSVAGNILRGLNG